MLSSVLLTGLLVVGLTVATHAIGTTYWLRVTMRSLSSESEWRMRTALWALTSTAVVFLMLHVVEVLMWAFTYLALPQVTSLTTFEEAAYFSLVTFTTLGYGDITLSGTWRLLSGIESMNGILLFGWTTASFFSVVQRLTVAVRRTRDS